MSVLKTREKIIDLLPKVVVGNVEFVLSGSSTKNISSGIRVSYVQSGSRYIKIMKKIPRTYSVGNAFAVIGDPYSIDLGTEVSLENTRWLLDSVTTKGFSATELLI